MTQWANEVVVNCKICQNTIITPETSMTISVITINVETTTINDKLVKGTFLITFDEEIKVND